MLRFAVRPPGWGEGFRSCRHLRTYSDKRAPLCDTHLAHSRGDSRPMPPFSYGSTFKSFVTSSLPSPAKRMLQPPRALPRTDRAGKSDVIALDCDRNLVGIDAGVTSECRPPSVRAMNGQAERDQRTERPQLSRVLSWPIARCGEAGPPQMLVQLITGRLVVHQHHPATSRVR